MLTNNFVFGCFPVILISFSIYYVFLLVIGWCRYEVVSVVIRPSNSLKITFLEVCSDNHELFNIICPIPILIYYNLSYSYSYLLLAILLAHVCAHTWINNSNALVWWILCLFLILSWSFWFITTMLIEVVVGQMECLMGIRVVFYCIGLLLCFLFFVWGEWWNLEVLSFCGYIWHALAPLRVVFYWAFVIQPSH